MKRIAVIVALLALVPQRSAHGHPPPFWWMADLTRTDRAGFELSIGNPHPGPFDAFALVGGVFGEVSVSSRLSFTGRIPLAFATFDPPTGGGSSSPALGNITLGLQGTMPGRRSGGLRTLWGGGFLLYLPTASDGTASSVTSAAARQLSLPDDGRWLLDTTTFRLRGDLRLESRVFFFQTELAIDLHFRSGRDDADLVVILGPGVAVSESLAFLLELAVADITDDDQITVDLGLRYHSPAVLIGARLYLPLSDPARRDNVFALAVDVGGRF